MMKRMVCRIIRLCLPALALVLCLGGCAGRGAAVKNTAVGYCLDTVVTLTGYCPEETLRGALELCGEYEALFSRTMEGSDVWRINHAGGEPVQVDGHTYRLLEEALEVCRESGGAFDITIAPAVELWDFKGDSHALPSAEALAAAAERTDYTRLKLSEGRVTLPEGMAIDLGGVGKGYIADRLTEYLAANGAESALLNLGGNVTVLGNKPDGTPWYVGIQSPEAPAGQHFAMVQAADTSVVTSGVYERGFDLDGVRYHHILDAQTGWPVQNGLACVTVISESSALADALSTACFALGAEEGLALAGRMGAEAAFLTAKGELICTPGMERILEIC